MSPCSVGLIGPTETERPEVLVKGLPKIVRWVSACVSVMIIVDIQIILEWTGAFGSLRQN